MCPAALRAWDSIFTGRILVGALKIDTEGFHSRSERFDRLWGVEQYDLDVLKVTSAVAWTLDW